MAEPTGLPEPELTSTIEVIRRGIKTTPQLAQGIGLTASMGVIFALGQITVPIVIQQAIDRGGLSSGTVDVDTVATLGVLGIAVVVATELLGVFVKNRLISRAEGSLRELRVLAFGHAHKLSLQHHNEQSTGVLISRVTSDVDSLARFADWGLFTWLVQPVVVIGIFITIAVYSWQLALIGIVLFLPVYSALRWVRGRMAAAHDARRTAIGDLLGAFTETLNGAEVIRAYNAEEVMAERLDEVSERRYDAGIKANVFMSGVYVVGDLIGTTMMAVLLVVGVVQRDALGLSAGELIAILTLATLLQSPIAELGETINSAQQAVAGWRKVLGLLDRRVEIAETAGAIELAPGALSIETRDLGFAYNDGEQVLRDVSVTIDAGTRVAIVGETGSGKSTFARMLCRLAEPQHGAVLIGGQTLNDVSDASRRRSIRMVPQDGFLFNTTVGQNIRSGRKDATDADIAEAIDLLGLSEWIASLPNGLDTEVGERGSLLSVGERQLVSFARAAVADPGLLILDEATSSVDPQTDLQLTRAIEQVSVGRTVISIAHRLATAEAADLVLVFDQGQLVESGPHDVLAAGTGPYSKLYAAWSSSAQ